MDEEMRLKNDNRDISQPHDEISLLREVRRESFYYVILKRTRVLGIKICLG